MGNNVNVKQCSDYLITFIQNKWLDMYRFYTLKRKTRVLFLFKTLELLHTRASTLLTILCPAHIESDVKRFWVPQTEREKWK